MKSERRSVTVLPKLKVCYWLLTAALVIIAENCWPQKRPYEKYVQLSLPLSLCQQKEPELWVREHRISMSAEAEITSMWCSAFKFILQKIDRGRWKRDRQINDWKGKGQEINWRIEGNPTDWIQLTDSPERQTEKNVHI